MIVLAATLPLRLGRDASPYQFNIKRCLMQTLVGRTVLGEPSFGGRMAAVQFMWKSLRTDYGSISVLPWVAL
jgi:hypothetical protein